MFVKLRDLKPGEMVRNIDINVSDLAHAKIMEQATEVLKGQGLEVFTVSVNIRAEAQVLVGDMREAAAFLDSVDPLE